MHNKGATKFNQETTVLKNILLLSKNIISKNNLLRDVHLLNPSQLHPEILRSSRIPQGKQHISLSSKHKEFFAKSNWYLHIIWVVD